MLLKKLTSYLNKHFINIEGKIKVNLIDKLNLKIKFKMFNPFYISFIKKKNLKLKKLFILIVLFCLLSINFYFKSSKTIEIKVAESKTDEMFELQYAE
jgi:hypothetical protein